MERVVHRKKKWSINTCQNEQECVHFNSLKVIYASIAAKYERQMEIGATSTFGKGEVTWNLAPVIADKTLIEFISPAKKDQKWFYEELERGTKGKGLK